MDEKGLTLGMSNRAKVICGAERHPLQGGTHEMITVMETVCAAQFSYDRSSFIREPLTLKAGIPKEEAEGDADVK